MKVGRHGVEQTKMYYWQLLAPLIMNREGGYLDLMQGRVRMIIEEKRLWLEVRFKCVYIIMKSDMNRLNRGRL